MGIISFFFTRHENTRLTKDNETLRGRVNSLERELKTEKLRHQTEMRDEYLRNRRYETALVKQVVISKGFIPVQPKPDNLGFEESVVKNTKKDAESLKQIEVEKMAFVADSVRAGKSKEEAESYFDEHQEELLANL